MVSEQWAAGQVLEIEVLMYAALVLMLITLIVNVIGSMLMVYAQRGTK